MVSVIQGNFEMTCACVRACMCVYVCVCVSACLCWCRNAGSLTFFPPFLQVNKFISVGSLAKHTSNTAARTALELPSQLMSLTCVDIRDERDR